MFPISLCAIKKVEFSFVRKFIKIKGKIWNRLTRHSFVNWCVLFPFFNFVKRTSDLLTNEIYILKMK